MAQTERALDPARERVLKEIGELLRWLGRVAADSSGNYRISALSSVRTNDTPNGLLSAHFPDAVKEGDTVLAAAPRGDLNLPFPELYGALVVSEGVGLTNTLALLRQLPVSVVRNLEVVHFRGGEPLRLLDRERAALARESGCLCRIQDGSPSAQSLLDPTRLTSVDVPPLS